MTTQNDQLICAALALILQRLSLGDDHECEAMIKRLEFIGDSSEHKELSRP